MKDEKLILDFYRKNEYVKRSNLDVSSDGGTHIRWKVNAVIPKILKVVKLLEVENISLLDVGAGTGIGLKLISQDLGKFHSVGVRKYTVDLSPAFIEMQIKNNPDIVLALNEDIRQTSLSDKQIDVSLMIDVLEHIPKPESALRELGRISRFTVFKQPLEDNLLLNAYNLLSGDKQKSRGRESVGHINFYNFDSFKESIESCGGRIVEYNYTNVFEYRRESGYYNGKHPLKKIINEIGSITYKISPRLSSRLFNNFLVALIKWEA